MPHRLLAFMNSRVLHWARAQSGLSLDDAASRAGVSCEQLIAWESGQGRPSLVHLRQLASVYGLSFGVFFLPEPPMDTGETRNAARR